MSKLQTLILMIFSTIAYFFSVIYLITYQQQLKTMERQSQNILDQILHKMSQADINFSLEEIPSKVLMLMGDSKAGKTTLLYYLLGKPLHQKTNELGVKILEAQTIYNNALIGTGYESTTVYPNFPPDSGVEDLLIIDMPGSNDTRPVYRLLNIYILLETIKLIEQVHLCVVIPEYNLEASQLLAEFQKICGFFKEEYVREGKAVSFIITKVQDEEALQKFGEEIQSFTQEEEYEHLKGSLEVFSESNRYVFKNQEPVLDEGVKLKHQIVQQNKFVAINRNYKQFLSSNFCKNMVGQSKIQDFYIRLQEVVAQIGKHVKYLIKYTQNVVYYQFSEILAFLLQKEVTDYEEGIKSVIIQLRNEEHLIIFDKLSFQPVRSQIMSKEKFIGIFKVFDRKIQPNQMFNLSSFLKRMISLLIWDETWTSFSRDCISKLQEIFKHLQSLFVIMNLIDDQEIRKMLQQVNINSDILSIIDQFYELWETKSQNLINHQFIKQTLDSPQVRSFCQGIGLKMPVYLNLKNKQIKTEVQKILKTKIVFNRVQDLPNQKKLPQELTQAQISQLPRSRNSLSWILQYLKSQQGLTQSLARALINTATDILIRFSLVEEAIVFKLSVSAIDEVAQLLDYGTIYSLLSAQFVETILVPFYEGVPSVESRKRMLVCYRYLWTLAGNEEEFVRLRQQFLRKDSLFKKNIETSQWQHEKYQSVNYEYIRPILQSSSNYLQYIARKQMQFERSHMKKLVNTAAFKELSMRCI